MTFHFQPSDYGSYIEQDFRHRWLRPQHLLAKLEKFKAHGDFNIHLAGHSIEGRDINCIDYGQGACKILMWSQMHGNEPTATMALMDLLNFLSTNDKYDPLRAFLKKNLTLCIIPMLNPDGAERFSRRNALSIDLNRDAVSQQMPELNVLLEKARNMKPHWAFNLHDQRSIFSAGNTSKPAIISFLSASAEEKREETPTRIKSMQLIGELADLVEENIHGYCGRYTDEFYPRALGEYFHRQEIPCVLIESGAYYDDPYRDMARKLNFLCFIKALQLIANDEFHGNDTSKYLSIPQNHQNIFDLIIRQCVLHYKGQTFTADLGFLYQESANPDTQKLERIMILQDVGDLSFHHGLREENGGDLMLDEENLKLEAAAHFSIIRDDQQNLIFKNGILQ